jgi:hypothetical protein
MNLLLPGLTMGAAMTGCGGGGGGGGAGSGIGSGRGGGHGGNGLRMMWKIASKGGGAQFLIISV